MSKFKAVWLPAMFWEDHAERDLPSGTLLRSAGHRVQVAVSGSELNEIESDAVYYSADVDCYPELIASAKRTVVAIQKIKAAA